MSLLEKVKDRSPHAITNADVVVRDQFVEYVSDNALRRELKQLIRRQPTMTLLEVRGEAIRWEREGMPGGARGRRHSVPSFGGIQYGVQEGASLGSSFGNQSVELRELRELLQHQQQQINQLTQALAQNQSPHFHRQYPRSDRLICRRCQQPGHFARECNGERRPPCPPTEVFCCLSGFRVEVVADSPTFGKLVPTGLQSHSSVGGAFGSQFPGSNESVSRLVSACPHSLVKIGGVPVPCLIDTGSMVSTITERCFQQQFEQRGQDHLQSCRWLQPRAANGLEIPYIGYMELDVEFCGKVLSNCGVLVVRDPPSGWSADVPGILGMNVLSRCYRELFGQHGSALFELPFVTRDLSIAQAFQDCQRATRVSNQGGDVRVRGRKVCRIPGGTMKLVAATCSALYMGSTVLFEPPETGLPAGLLASPALVPVVGGTVYVPLVNVGTVDVVLYPTTVIGELREVYLTDLPVGVAEVPSVVAQVAAGGVSSTPVPDQIESVDLGGLLVEEQLQVKALLLEYQGVFSMHEGDLGCTRLLSHEIPLTDDVPVRQRYRRIPPSEYELVKTHINQLLDSQII